MNNLNNGMKLSLSSNEESPLSVRPEPKRRQALKQYTRSTRQESRNAARNARFYSNDE